MLREHFMKINFKNIFSLFKPSSDNIIDDKVVVAEVLSFEKHPNADRLRVVKLNTGDKVVEPIVCGAFNFEVGDKVVLALPDAEITHNLRDPEGKPFTLTKATIRGVESQGMICAAYELGVGSLNDEPGILILKPEAQTGSKFSPDLIQ
ncbi:MAG: hypothetical protein A3J48_01785 [Candidatus Doudnabacteria bacterium RIFCSPHIGHO2_02_FULL_46_11]|uniref:tRNA-binding domain-containing protein n=1 Tax=Candidatus Doudnabacteria bacterium RIFCSPHIGHO2_02_FULL_46_11 TaxID=1817832 RepID=A0A1F5P9L1_9BACT|nr:MAG: hypothetical protein A3J48_01785 [Candidatus Doudnabacteria bacterium RIFCSPHIGHO2_02_FULL_46_11]